MGIVSMLDNRIRWTSHLAVAGVFVCMGSGATAGDGPAFSEVSALVGLVTTQTPSPNLVASPFDVSRMMGAGAIGDFDRDGRQDVFVLSGGTQPDRLFMNTGTGFLERAAEAGLDAQHIGIGACVGDIDGDGWLDIFVTSFGRSENAGDPVQDQHRLYRNNGDGTFTDIADAAGLRSLDWTIPAGWGPAFGDYDLDGDLDLAIPSWTRGGPWLMRNEGDGTFTDVSDAAGVRNTMTQGFSATFADMDGDRYPELLVAGDYGTSLYFRNNRDGTFTETTVDSGVGLDDNGMGHVVADLDGDRDPDWFVTSIHSAQVQTPSIPGTGNFLYRNDGGHTFAVPEPAETTIDGGWGWGVEAVDIDHDGRLDLIETNGWPLPNAAGQLEWQSDPCFVWRNLGGMSFQNIAASCGLDWAGQGRGLVRLDLENDGDQDILIFAYNDAVRVYRNELASGPDRGWLRVGLDTAGHPRLAPDGFGTAIEVTAGGITQFRQMHGGSTYASQSELTAHFGLADARIIDEIRVRWNDGSVTVLTNVRPNQHLVIESGFSSDLDGNGSAGFMDLLTMLSRYAQPDPAADLDADGLVDVDDVIILLENWGVI
jgi:hypothetical protein